MLTWHNWFVGHSLCSWLYGGGHVLSHRMHCAVLHPLWSVLCYNLPGEERVESETHSAIVVMCKNDKFCGICTYTCTMQVTMYLALTVELLLTPDADTDGLVPSIQVHTKINKYMYMHVYIKYNEKAYMCFKHMMRTPQLDRFTLLYSPLMCMYIQLCVHVQMYPHNSCIRAGT